MMGTFKKKDNTDIFHILVKLTEMENAKAFVKNIENYLHKMLLPKHGI